MIRTFGGHSSLQIALDVMVSSHILAIFAVASSLLSLAHAAKNVTVDDEAGDEVTRATPTYSPASEWNLGSNCTGCRLKPDANQAYGGTWHDSTCRPGDAPFTAEISFTGTAVYVYFILSENQLGAAVNTHLSFVLDGSVAGTFDYYPAANATFEYNALGYANGSLENIAHTFIMQSVANTDQSVVLFDRLVYTSEDDSVTGTTSTSSGSTLSTMSASVPQSGDSSGERGQASSKAPQGAIIGGSVAAGVAVLVILVMAVFCIRQRRRRAVDNSVTAFVTPRQRPRTVKRGSIDVADDIIRVQRDKPEFLASGSSRTDSITVAPPSSEINGRATFHNVLFVSQKDLVGGNERERKRERITPTSAAQTSASSNGSSPTLWESGRRGVRSEAARERPNEDILLNQIATLRAEVARLHDRHSLPNIPPPEYDGHVEQHTV